MTRPGHLKTWDSVGYALPRYFVPKMRSPASPRPGRM